MHYAFDFLPLEVQTSIKELIAFGAPEGAVDLLVARTSKAIEAKTISAQRQVVEIEHSLEQRVDRIGDKLAGDLRTVLGETNGMLIDIRTSQQGQETAVGELRAEFHHGIQQVGERLTDLEAWQPHVEQELASFRESRDQSKAQRTRTENAVTALAQQFKAFTDRIEGLIAQSVPQEKAEQYRAFLDQLMAEHEAGG